MIFETQIPYFSTKWTQTICADMMGAVTMTTTEIRATGYLCQSHHQLDFESKHGLKIPKHFRFFSSNKGLRCGRGGGGWHGMVQRTAVEVTRPGCWARPRKLQRPSAAVSRRPLTATAHQAPCPRTANLDPISLITSAAKCAHLSPVSSLASDSRHMSLCLVWDQAPCSDPLDICI